MTAYELPWLQPRPILWTAVERAIWTAYEAEHSVTGYPDGTVVEPPVELRSRVLDITSRLPQLPPCEQDEPGPDIDCLTCEDTGELQIGEWGFPMLCPDCARGDWTWRHELNDDALRGK